jgi:hypothetical protein
MAHNQLTITHLEINRFKYYCDKYIIPFISIIWSLLFASFIFILLIIFEGKVFDDLNNKYFLFNNEKEIIILIVTSFIFAAMNTISYLIHILNTATKNYKNSRKVYLLKLAQMVSILCFSSLIIYCVILMVFCYCVKIEIIIQLLGINEYFSLIIFILFLLIDILSMKFMNVNINNVSDKGEKDEKEVDKEFVKRSIYFIDSPIILSLLVFVCLIPLLNTHFNGITVNGVKQFNTLVYGPQKFIEHVKWISDGMFSVGAIAMQILLSQIIFLILAAMNYYSRGKLLNP